ncbi:MULTISPECIES: C40 family peptidase [Ectothiorhodospira]|uniref:C40 family peptidase n=1 Tax=Ectothiorhodospira TaxID=1051 RepID=UPI00024A8B5F|nr:MULTISPECIES: C40 family peptidase [Ectothiorhodospira]EHQ53138.1 Nlp family transcriptional regulator [Ectothiorhodospira sp. PHS-1]MCG5511839.1 C40 family peptidase [Ectothiorhodospira shaposhnikovii]
MSPWLRLALVAATLLLGACGTSPTRPPADPETLDPQRSQVVFHALSMVGKPYRYGGTSPEDGFDCSGLVWFTHHHAGIPVPRTTTTQSEGVRRISTQALTPGDLLFFRTGRAGPGHVSIYIGDGRFVHAPSSGRPVTTEDLDHPYWSRRFLHAGHFYSP